MPAPQQAKPRVQQIMMLSRAGGKDLDDVEKGGALKSDQESHLSSGRTKAAVWPLVIDSSTRSFQLFTWKQRTLYFARLLLKRE